MASKARMAFDSNAGDIDRLLAIHRDLGGDARGRRFQLEVLNKSAIVLITSFWEAYCEDLAAESLEHIVRHLKTAGSLSKEIKKLVAKELESDPNHLAMWGLSDDGWRNVLQVRFARLQEQRNRRLRIILPFTLQPLKVGIRSVCDKGTRRGVGAIRLAATARVMGSGGYIDVCPSDPCNALHMRIGWGVH